MVAIGDVHGCLKTLKALVAKLPKDQEIFFCGDLIDRGPNSAGVIDYVRSNKFKCVLGNHEKMMLDHVFETEYSDGVWFRNGGYQTINNYDMISKDKNRFYKDADWLLSLPYYIELDDVIISHSAVLNIWNMDKEDPHFKQLILWNRHNLALDKDYGVNKYNIFGHTPHPEPIISKYYANIDTGCVYNLKDEGYYKLTALQYPEMIVYQQENLE